VASVPPGQFAKLVKAVVHVVLLYKEGEADLTRRKCSLFVVQTLKDLATMKLPVLTLLLAPVQAILEKEWTFQMWADHHSKVYSSQEALQRERIWHANRAAVRQHNEAHSRGWTSYTMSIASPFSDMTSEEFENLYLMEPQHCSATKAPKLRTGLQEIASRDWRTKGIFTHVKNQGHCGSCWTFSTTGCLESHLCLAYGKDCTQWKGLAEQQLVDCAGAYNNNGCSGGLPSQAFEYIKYNGGLDFEEAYPYQAQDEICKYRSSKVGGKVAEVYNITTGDEDDLAFAISTIGPVSIAYQVSPDFRLYQHGVYDSYNATTNSTMCHNKPSDVNHAVVAVGVDETEKGVPFYIVRNSWGTSWGMEGHFWMKRGENLCGVSDCASFPIVPEGSFMEQE